MTTAVGAGGVTETVTGPDLVVTPVRLSVTPAIAVSPASIRPLALVRVKSVTSALSGWLAVWGLLRLVRTHSFTPFVIYRVCLGLFVMLLLALGVLSA